MGINGDILTLKLLVKLFGNKAMVVDVITDLSKLNNKWKGGGANWTSQKGVVINAYIQEIMMNR
jgi:hypothetical protein